MSLSLHIPIRTHSELNERCHWAVRNKRRTSQKKAVYYAWKEAMFGRKSPKLPCVVHLTRFGPRLLDGDNLQGALKFCRDTVAELIGVDDGDPRIQFVYDQRVDADYAVVIQVEGR